MNVHRIVSLSLVVAAAIAVAGCGKPGEPSTPVESVATVPAALIAVFGEVKANPEIPAIPVLRKTAKPGDEIVLEAKVMGTKQPFVDKRALFVVGDEGTLVSCDVRDGDTCPTPWDTCCDDPNDILVGTATIQVVDESGSVLRHGIKGVGGLRELSRVRIAGVVSPASSEAALIINASRIQVL